MPLLEKQSLKVKPIVNPFYIEGIGRRTGAVLKTDVRKDSDGFEVFDDYFTDSEAENSELSFDVNKENISVLNRGRSGQRGRGKSRGNKRSSPLRSMNSFSPVLSPEGSPLYATKEPEKPQERIRNKDDEVDDVTDDVDDVTDDVDDVTDDVDTKDEEDIGSTVASAVEEDKPTTDEEVEVEEDVETGTDQNEDGETEEGEMDDARGVQNSASEKEEMEREDHPTGEEDKPNTVVKKTVERNEVSASPMQTQIFPLTKKRLSFSCATEEEEDSSQSETLPQETNSVSKDKGKTVSELHGNKELEPTSFFDAASRASGQVFSFRFSELLSSTAYLTEGQSPAAEEADIVMVSEGSEKSFVDKRGRKSAVNERKDPKTNQRSETSKRKSAKTGRKKIDLHEPEKVQATVQRSDPGTLNVTTSQTKTNVSTVVVDVHAPMDLQDGVEGGGASSSTTETIKDSDTMFEIIDDTDCVAEVDNVDIEKIANDSKAKERKRKSSGNRSDRIKTKRGKNQQTDDQEVSRRSETRKSRGRKKSEPPPPPATDQEDETMQRTDGELQTQAEEEAKEVLATDAAGKRRSRRILSQQSSIGDLHQEEDGEREVVLGNGGTHMAQETGSTKNRVERGDEGSISTSRDDVEKSAGLTTVSRQNSRRNKSLSRRKEKESSPDDEEETQDEMIPIVVDEGASGTEKEISEDSQNEEKVEEQTGLKQRGKRKSESSGMSSSDGKNKTERQTRRGKSRKSKATLEVAEEDGIRLKEQQNSQTNSSSAEEQAEDAVDSSQKESLLEKSTQDALQRRTTRKRRGTRQSDSENDSRGGLERFEKEKSLRQKSSDDDSEQTTKDKRAEEAKRGGKSNSELSSSDCQSEKVVTNKRRVSKRGRRKNSVASSTVVEEVINVQEACEEMVEPSIEGQRLDVVEDSLQEAVEEQEDADGRKNEDASASSESGDRKTRRSTDLHSTKSKVKRGDRSKEERIHTVKKTLDYAEEESPAGDEQEEDEQEEDEQEGDEQEEDLDGTDEAESQIDGDEMDAESVDSVQDDDGGITTAESSERRESSPCQPQAGPFSPQSILKSAKVVRKHRLHSKKQRCRFTFENIPLAKAWIIPPDQEGHSAARRSKRNRVRPLEFWRNERAIYERRKSGGFALKGINSPEGEDRPHVRKNGIRRRKRQKGSHTIPITPKNLSVHLPVPEEANEGSSDPVAVVNPETQREVLVNVVRTPNTSLYVGPTGSTPSDTDNILIAKSLLQPAFNSGTLLIRAESEKGLQLLQRDTMIFYIVRGKLAVTIHQTTQTLESGTFFFVPPGNVYNILNLRRDEAKLVFFQHKGPE